MKRKIVPDIVKPREIISVSREDKIIDAAAKMVDAHVAALVVFDDKENLVGIVTERDMTHRVVAKGLVACIRDLFAAVKMSLEEDVQETEAFVFGDQYGA